ncbi:MAG: hypothetical protein EOO01_01290 [Chitinophagaceae bacterium]|nr:MAG: hypothetical protein EOO01_01290 [Chitinophagaceae bacterium]
MQTIYKEDRPELPVPQWADFFSEAQYSQFINIVGTYFRSKGVPYSIQTGAILRLADKAYGVEKIGLLNLAQTCKRVPSSVWNDMVEKHFEGMRTAAAFEVEFNKKAHDYSFVKEFIAVRLYHNDYVAAIKDGLTIGKQIADNIYAMLVYDFPHSVINVRPEQTIQWDRTNQALFEEGLANVRKKYSFRLTKEPLAEVEIYLVAEDHFYAPNIIFDLEERSEIVSEKGLLVGVPSRHAALIYPINDMQMLTAINRMIPVIHGMCKDGPGSISDKLYWHYQGKFIDLPYTLDEKNIQFYPPPKFVDILNWFGE